MTPKLTAILLTIVALTTVVMGSDHARYMGSYSMTVPDDWVATFNSQASINYLYIPAKATVSITTYDTLTAPTPGIVEAIRIHDYYDGWILHFRRDLTDSEARRANALMGSISVYGFSRLTTANTVINRVNIEYTYTSKHSAAVIRIDTDDSKWKSIESAVKNFVSMFKIK